MSTVRSCSNPTCGNTESRPGEFKKCSRCKSACYCSKECQLAHWKNGHRKECKPVEPETGKSASSAETKTDMSDDQRALLKKEFQTMYNNSQMAKAEMLKLKQELELKKITLKKLEEMDSGKSVFCSFGSMYMNQPYESALKDLKDKVSALNQKIESVGKQLQYFEKRYKEMSDNYPDL